MSERLVATVDYVHGIAGRMERFHFRFAIAYIAVLFLNAFTGTVLALATDIPWWPNPIIFVVLACALFWHLNRLDHWDPR